MTPKHTRIGRLFDVPPSGDHRLPMPHEPEYSYLAQSGRVEAQRVRDLMEALLLRAPASKRQEIAAYFRRPDDRQHFGAALELTCAGVLDRLGASVEAGSYDNGQRTPDFQATWPDGALFVECKVVTETQDGLRHRETITAALEQVQNREFYISIRDWEEYPPKMPEDLEEMKAELRAWLDTKRHVDVIGPLVPSSSAWEVRDRAPKLKFLRDKWHFTAYAIPKAKGAIGSTAKAPYASPDDVVRPFEEVLSHIKLRDDFAKKADRYKHAPLPLVLAGTTLRWKLHDPDIRAALYGTHKIRLQDGSPSESFYEADGLWTRPPAPRFEHIAAVMLLTNATPWELGRGQVVVYENPWTKHTLPEAMRGLSTVRADPDGRLITTRGPSLRELFNLPVDWPEQQEPR